MTTDPDKPLYQPTNDDPQMGGIISEWWARSSRNGWAASSESAPGGAEPKTNPGKSYNIARATDGLITGVTTQGSASATAKTHYIYDLDGRLLAEQNGATGAVVKEYAWIDDMPLAVLDSSSGAPTTYYIHTGPVNEPLAMTNSAKAIVWNAYMEPFGAATVFGTASASIDMRLPGQSLEAESGNLNQNWFRDYDPSLGQYMQTDLVGRIARISLRPLTHSHPRMKVSRYSVNRIPLTH